MKIEQRFLKKSANIDIRQKYHVRFFYLIKSQKKK